MQNQVVIMKSRHHKKSRSEKIQNSHLKRFLDHHFRLANWVLAIPLERVDLPLQRIPLNYISNALSRRLLNRSNSRSTWKSWILWFACVILVTQIIRCFIMGLVILDDRHTLVTWFGSFFSLIHAERRPVEITVLNTTILALLYLLLANSRWSGLFVVLIKYLAQLGFNSEIRFTPKLGRVTRQKLRKQYLVFLYGETLLCFGTVFAVFLLTAASLSIANPQRNNYHLFHFNPLIYYGIYLNSVTFWWTIWMSCAAPVIFALFTYYTITTKLIYGKAEAQWNELRKLRNFGVARNTRHLVRNLGHHLSGQQQLLEEINTINQFWSLYLSATQLTLSFIACYLLYIIFFGHIIWFFKIFFSYVFCSVVTILLVTLLAASGVFRQVHRCYPLYHQFLASPKANSINVQDRLKVCRICYKLLLFLF